jgi:hypothetical protein
MKKLTLGLAALIAAPPCLDRLSGTLDNLQRVLMFGGRLAKAGAAGCG